MKKQTFYPTIWSPMPFSIDLMAQRDASGKRIKELILKNEMVAELGVSEMELSITKFAAVDADGKEYDILNFPGQNDLNIKGMASGHFLRSGSVLNLKSGTYTKLRFYLGQQNEFSYSDGLVEEVFSYDCLDFTIENGLTLEGNEPAEVKLWFDFAPYKLSSYFKGFRDLFKGSQKPRPRLANGFGN